MDFQTYRKAIYEKREEVFDLFEAYWITYSSLNDWQFWVTLIVFVVPLGLLFFVVDRKRIFEVFFFGYTVHILWTYASIILENNNWMNHTYFLHPMLPSSLNITTSILPVGFLLVYQYTTKHKKNFYLYTILLSAVFAFVFASIELMLGLIEFHNGANMFHLFLIDFIVAFIAYWFTLFLKSVRDKHVKRQV
jgi:hypothetical protein